ncbi:MAG: bifunctional acetate--CoA ligase family protein/GNAT family N-acetyltransferase [Nevskia sp.]|nr:bifunctional acetate--CoA ligase family protein/GNAT family N-acetyltransferase [Nevskia sp.]
MSTYNLDALFHAEHLLWLGQANDAATRQLQSNCESSLPAEQRSLVGASHAGWHTVEEQAAWPRSDLAILPDPAWLRADIVGRLVQAGVRAALLTANGPAPADFAGAARQQGLRLLGPRSAGLGCGAGAMNLTTLAARILPGKLALISQSQTVAAAALDWACGRGLGFSWMAITGAEADADAADLLDYAALDPHTRAVVLQLGKIRDGRKFMSAARACARGKPVVVLQTNPQGMSGPIGPDPVRSAAFRRAGLVECGTLAGLFDALTAMERLPPADGNGVIIAGNGTGICALGVDAALRHGLQPATLNEADRRRIQQAVPSARFMPGAVDLGDLEPAALVETLSLLAKAPGENPVLYIRAPLPGARHEDLANAVAGAGLAPRVLTVWLGLDTALPARRVSAAAGNATFTSPDAAARAIKCRWEARRTQELLTRTPPADACCPESRRHVSAQLEQWAEAGRLEVHGAPAAVVFDAYGLPVHPGHPGGWRLKLQVRSHGELGTYLCLAPSDVVARTGQDYGFPPLDPLLARRMLEDAGIATGAPGEDVFLDALGGGLERVSRLVLEQARLSSADLQIEAGGDGSLGVVIDTLRVGLRSDSVAERRRLVLAPYPSELEHGLPLKDGRHFLVRAVRPSDEPALLRLLARTDPEAIRLRFFHVMRHFSHAMAARMTQIDYDREMTLVACPADAPDEIVAVATLVREGSGKRAEFAVLVHQDYAHAGLGRHLMLQLLAHGRRSGIAVIHGDVLSENLPMRALAHQLGFSDHADPEELGCRKVETTLEPTP